MKAANTISIDAAARLLGTYRSMVDRMIARRWLHRQSGGVTRADLRRLVTDRRCWLLLSPSTIADPELRMYAFEAQRMAAGAHWWTTAELAAYHHVALSTLQLWRAKGWARERAWFQLGQAWFLWCITPPAPWRESPTRPKARARARNHRIAVVQAVVSAGGPPGRWGCRDFWGQIAAELGILAETARNRWYTAVRYGEVTHEPTR
jgi:hypothetical protein